jgi:MFS transporter (putative signal transducer)
MSAARDGASASAVVLGIGGLYVAQSVISGITWTGLPAVMREAGVGLDKIGLVSLIALPWALKFLWSPAVERFRLPAGGGNRSGTVVLIGGLISVAGLLVAGALDPASAVPLLLVLTVVAFAASTVDIACDGYAVQALRPRDHGWGNAAQVGGAYVGAAIGGGLFLYLVDALDWRMATWAMAATVVALGLPFMLGPAGRAGPPGEASHRPSIAAAFKRPEIRRGMIAAAVYVIAQKGALAMIGPLMVDAGYALATIGLLNGIGSMGVGLAAALAGGAAVRRWGVRAILVAALFMQAACLAGISAIAITDTAAGMLLPVLAVASTSGVMAFGFVALYAQFMRWSDPRQAGVDFTLFQCMDALVSMGGGVVAGQVAHAFGYGVFFSVAAGIAIAAIPAMIAVSRPEPQPA